MTFTIAKFNLEPIAANPSRVKRFLAWGTRWNRAAAVDSLRNVFAVLGAGAVLAHLSVLSWPLACIGGGLVSAVWYADYLRHF
jgi:hypothetical protein